MMGIGRRADFGLERAQMAPKIALVVTVAAILAGSMTVFAGAHGIGGPPATFADRFAVTPVADCNGSGWPYLATTCLRRQDGMPVRPVRIIALDQQN